MTVAAIDDKVRRVVSSIRNLPTPPIVFEQIQKVMSDPRASATQVGAVLSEDPAMSVKVLKLTNSAFYGLSREVSSVKHAVVIIGMEAVKNLVLSASVLDMFKGKNVDKDYQERFWRHSLAVACCCRVLSRRGRSGRLVDPEISFSAGLLHDIGKMVISCYLPEEFARFREVRATDRVLTDVQLEEQVCGFTHTQIGAYLAAHWKLPQQLCNAIAYHHRPDSCKQPSPIVMVTHVGDYIAKKVFFDRDEAHLVGSVESQVMESLRLDDEDLADIDDVLRAEFQRAETFMQIASLD